MFLLEKLLEFITEFWTVSCQMAPALLFGFLMAGIMSIIISPEYVQTHLGKRGFVSVLKSALFGVPLPLCSCGVIPVSTSLRKSGASKGAVTAFLISTPQTGVDSILVTYSMLGGFFAIFRPIVAFAAGLFGGVLADRFAEDEEEVESECSGSCCSEKSDSEDNSGSTFVAALKYGFITLMGDVAKPLLLGISVASLISITVSPDLYTSTIGTGIISLFVSMVIMVLFGLPLYVCATASVPIAVSLIAKGVPPGAALVFLMAGPATNAATIATIWKTIGKRTAFLYLFSVIFMAFAAGFVVEVIGAGYIDQLKDHCSHDEKTSLIAIISGILLYSLIFFCFARKLFTGNKKEQNDPESINLTIKGMSCEHCKSTVEKALNDIAGIKGTEIDISTGKCKVIFDHINSLDIEVVTKAIDKAGFIVDNVDK